MIGGGGHGPVAPSLDPPLASVCVMPHLSEIDQCATELLMILAYHSVDCRTAVACRRA